MAPKPPHQPPQSPAAQLRGRGGAQRLPIRVACLMMPAAVGTRLLRGAPHSHAYETSSPDDLSSLSHTHRRMSCASTHASLAISTHPYPCATHGLRRLRSLAVRSTGGVALESQSMTHHHHTPCCVGPCARLQHLQLLTLSFIPCRQRCRTAQGRQALSWMRMAMQSILDASVMSLVAESCSRPSPACQTTAPSDPLPFSVP